jgi:hypothetical protein
MLDDVAELEKIPSKKIRSRRASALLWSEHLLALHDDIFIILNTFCLCAATTRGGALSVSAIWTKSSPVVRQSSRQPGHVT